MFDSYLSEYIIQDLGSGLQLLVCLVILLYRLLASISPISCVRSVQSTPVPCNEMLGYVFWGLYSVYIWPIAIPLDNVFHLSAGVDDMIQHVLH